ncbi:MAG: hypothetical protein R3B06_27070 [Kofleriaceae bacterium]
MAIVSPPSAPTLDTGARGEDRVIAVLVGGLGAARVALAIALHERFGGEVTLGLVMAVFGVLAWPWRR